MITTTSLQHPVTQAAINCALHACVKAYQAAEATDEASPRSFGATVYVQNAKGHSYMRIDYRPNEPIARRWRAYFAGSGADATETFLAALRHHEV